jgi:uncharacterized membrane protein
MRRIGIRHAIVLPAQVACMLDIEQVRRHRDALANQLGQLIAQERDIRARLDDVDAQLRAFDAMAIERSDDDPLVPQPEVEPVLHCTT